MRSLAQTWTRDHGTVGVDTTVFALWYTARPQISPDLYERSSKSTRFASFVRVGDPNEKELGESVQVQAGDTMRFPS